MCVANIIGNTLVTLTFWRIHLHHSPRREFNLIFNIAGKNKTYLGHARTVSDIFNTFKTNIYFLEQFSQKSLLLSFTEIRPVGTAVIHADTQRDMTYLLCTFRDYEKASKMINRNLQ